MKHQETINSFNNLELEGKEKEIRDQLVGWLESDDEDLPTLQLWNQFCDETHDGAYNENQEDDSLNFTDEELEPFSIKYFHLISKSE